MLGVRSSCLLRRRSEVGLRVILVADFEVEVEAEVEMVTFRFRGFLTVIDSIDTSCITVKQRCFGGAEKEKRGEVAGVSREGDGSG